MQRLTARIGAPAPSYSAVRRIASSARVQREPNAYVEEIATKLLTGRLPDLYRAELVHAERTRRGAG